MATRAGSPSSATGPTGRAWRPAGGAEGGGRGARREGVVRAEGDPRWFAIVSDWTDRAAVDAFGRSAARETLTEALRGLRDDATRSTFARRAGGEAGAPRPVRIDFSTSVKPGEQAAFERAYTTVAERIGDSRGYVREELLRDAGGLRYHIFAEWESEDDFVQWVEDAAHVTAGAPGDAAAARAYHIFAGWEAEDGFVQWVEDPSHMTAGAPLARWHSVEFRREVLEIRQRPDAGAEFPELVSPGGDVEVERVRVDSAVVVEPWEADAFELAYLAAAQLARSAPGHAREGPLRQRDGRRDPALAVRGPARRRPRGAAPRARRAAVPRRRRVGLRAALHRLGGGAGELDRRAAGPVAGAGGGPQGPRPARAPAAPRGDRPPR